MDAVQMHTQPTKMDTEQTDRVVSQNIPSSEKLINENVSFFSSRFGMYGNESKCILHGIE